MDDSFENDLRKIINKWSVENLLDMPDFVIAAMVISFLEAVGNAKDATQEWKQEPQTDGPHTDQTPE